MKKHNINENLSATASEVAKVARNMHGLYNVPESSFKLAFTDEEFLTGIETRGIRFQLEIMKPDVIFKREGIKHTITVFGSARFKSPEDAQELLANAKTPEEVKLANLAIKNSEYYTKAYDFGKIVGTRNVSLPSQERLHILTGGGPGLMEAANKGAFEAGDKTIGMNIALPFEQEPNPYITPQLCFDFHYFAARKFSFLSAGSSTVGYQLTQGNGMKEQQTNEGGGTAAMVCFPGGFGSLDELFECLTLIQVGKMKPRPTILVGKDYWNNLINFKFLAEQGAISEKDLSLIDIVDTAEEAWDIIKKFYNLAK